LKSPRLLTRTEHWHKPVGGQVTSARTDRRLDSSWAAIVLNVIIH